MRRFLLLLPLLAVSAFAQLDSYTVTVTASRSTSAAPDQAALLVTLVTDQMAGPDDAVGALSGLGITSANLTGLNSEISRIATLSGYQTEYQIAWSFSLNVPLASLNNEIRTLLRMSNTIAQRTGWSLTYGVQSIQASSSATAPCVIADVVSDARAEAAILAGAAGFGVGEVMALSDGTSTNETPQIVFASGIFPVSSLTNQIILHNYPTPDVPNCTVVVKFRLVTGV